jgi:sec-independent protein translocase protein TatB
MEIGWTELMVIGVVALIVIGPKDLPEMFRTLGRFTAKARSMARDFSRAMEQAAKDTGVDEVAKDLRNVTSPSSMGLSAVKNAADKFEKWDPLKNAAKPTSPAPVRSPPPMPPMAQPATAAAAVPATTPAELATDLASAAPATPAPVGPAPVPGVWSRVVSVPITPLWLLQTCLDEERFHPRSNMLLRRLRPVEQPARLQWAALMGLRISLPCAIDDLHHGSC